MPIGIEHREIGPFKVEIRIELDEDHDWTMGRGRFTDNWEPGAIEYKRERYTVATRLEYRYELTRSGMTRKLVHAHVYSGPKRRRFRYDTNVFRYFIPEVALADRVAWYVQNYDGTLTVQEARVQARDDLLKDIEIVANGGPYIAIGVVVQVSYDGIKVGESSCWGYEVENYDDPYVQSEIETHVDAAIDQAKETLTSLRGALNTEPSLQ